MTKSKKSSTQETLIAPPPSLRRLIAQHRQLALGIVVGVALIGLGWLVYMVVDDPAANTGEVVACSDEVLSEAAGVLEPIKYIELQQVSTKIRTLDGYDQDPNCLNVIVTAYVNLSDYTNARESLDKLEIVYRPSQGFSPVLGMNVKNIDVLRGDVDFLEKLEEQFRQNIRPGPEVES